MSEASLEPCWVKVRRAQAHFDVLNVEITSFLKTRPYSVVLKNESEKKVVAVAEALQEPPATWGVVIGDCVHNLRTALDYLVWQLVIANGGTPKGRNEFPITTDPGDYRESAWKVKGVSDGAAEIIEGLQPYPGRDDWRQDLRLLHDLDRYDKHRFLALTGYVLGFWRFICATRNGTATPERFNEGGPFNHGDVIGQVTFEPVGPNSNLDVSVEATFDVAFDDAESPAPNRFVLPTLIASMNAVRRTLESLAGCF